MLHITDGDSVIHGFREANLTGDYLSWLDVLHEGPVPAGLGFSELADVRAQALAQMGWDSLDGARAGFAQRNRKLEQARQHEEVVLWFEHDLFDQLQLIQALDWAGGSSLPCRLSLICPGGYLGPLNGQELLGLMPARAPVSDAQLALAGQAWAAFRSPSPTRLIELLDSDLSPLPYLRPALSRFLEEYPSLLNGLSRSAGQLLRMAAVGHRRRGDIFAAYCRTEDAIFMGDSSAWLRLDALASGAAPALSRVAADEFQITAQGQRLLAGEADWIRDSGGIDQWLGGVHLHGPESPWRWDGAARRMAGPAC